MQIVSKIPENISKQFALEQYWTGVFPISADVLDYVKKIISKDTIVLFSGSPNLSIEGVCIEPSMFSHLSIKWKNNTIFVDPKNQSLLHYVIKKQKSKQLLILNSNIFLQYRSWIDIQKDINVFTNIVNQVIVTIPVNRFDFNRLQFSNTEIATKLGGVIVEDTIVVCQ
jgi:hypothetical protein